MEFSFLDNKIKVISCGEKKEDFPNEPAHV